MHIHDIIYYYILALRKKRVYAHTRYHSHYLQYNCVKYIGIDFGIYILKSMVYNII